MSAKTWRWSNCELAVHSPQAVWASAAMCCKTTADRITGIKQIWPVSCNACYFRGLAASGMVMPPMSNHTVALQIPIAA